MANWWLLELLTAGSRCCVTWSPLYDIDVNIHPMQLWSFLKTRARRSVVDVALLLTVLLGVSLWQTRDHVRGPAPPLLLRSVDDTSVDLAALQGKPTLLVFVAPWCGVCKVQADNVERVRRWFGSDINVVNVVSEYEQRREVDAMIARDGITGTILLDDNGTSRRFHVGGFPTSFFIDAESRISTSSVGYTSTLGLWWRLWRT